MSHVREDLKESEYNKLPMEMLNAVTAAHTAVAELERAITALHAEETCEEGSEIYFRKMAHTALLQAWEHALLVDQEMRTYGERTGAIEKKVST